MTEQDASTEIGIRLGQTATPEFGNWLTREIKAADRVDIEVRESENVTRPGALGLGVVELWVALGGTAAILGPMVKPAMEFLWGKLFDYLQGQGAQDRPVPPTIQIVVLGEVVAIDTAKMSRELPDQIVRRLSKAPKEN